MEWLKAMMWYVASVALLGYALTSYVNPERSPGWLLPAELGAYTVVGFGGAFFFAFAKAETERRERERQESRQDLLALRKHLQMLQHLDCKAEPPHDPTRLPPEMLKAFQKDRQACAKD
jgi:hypothetical protein